MKNILKVMLVGLAGLNLACTTATNPTPTNEITAETIAKINTYGTSKGVTFTRTSDDIFYAITLAKPSGRVPKANEYVKLHYVYAKLDGTFLDSTAIIRNIPASFLLYPESISNRPLLNYVAGLMKEGEKSIVVFPSTNSITTEPTVLTATLVSTRNETEQIDEYVKEKFPNLPVKKTASGLQYLITKSSASGDTVKTGKTATIAYTGKFLYQFKSTDTNGFPSYTDKFETNTSSFLIGQGAIAGFEEAAKLLKSGDKGTFILPSSIAYGTSGKGTIPPYTPLIFEMEVTAVK